MAPLYELITEEFKLPVDQKLLAKWKQANEAELKKLDEKREDAEKNFGETEVYDALCQKAEYLAKICDKVIIIIMIRRTNE
jgi:26S proteasome regulatory subunit N7